MRFSFPESFKRYTTTITGFCRQTNYATYKHIFDFLGDRHVDVSNDPIKQKHRVIFSQCAKEYSLDARQKKCEKSHQTHVMKSKNVPYKGQLDYRLLHDKAFTVATHQSQIMPYFQNIPSRNAKKRVRESAEKYCAAVYSPSYYEGSKNVAKHKYLTDYDGLILSAFNLHCLSNLLEDNALPKVLPRVKADKSVLTAMKNHEKTLLVFAETIYSFAEHVSETYGIAIPDKQKRNFEPGQFP